MDGYKKMKRLMDRYVNYLNSIWKGFRFGTSRKCGVKTAEIYFELKVVGLDGNEWDEHFLESIYVGDYALYSYDQNQKVGTEVLIKRIFDNIMNGGDGHLVIGTSGKSVEVFKFSSLEELDIKLTLNGF